MVEVDVLSQQQQQPTAEATRSQSEETVSVRKYVGRRQTSASAANLILEHPGSQSDRKWQRKRSPTIVSTSLCKHPCEKKPVRRALGEGPPRPPPLPPPRPPLPPPPRASAMRHQNGDTAAEQFLCPPLSENESVNVERGTVSKKRPLFECTQQIGSRQLASPSELTSPTSEKENKSKSVERNDAEENTTISSLERNEGADQWTNPSEQQWCEGKKFANLGKKITSDTIASDGNYGSNSENQLQERSGKNQGDQRGSSSERAVSLSATCGRDKSSSNEYSIEKARLKHSTSRQDSRNVETKPKLEHETRTILNTAILCSFASVLFTCVAIYCVIRETALMPGSGDKHCQDVEERLERLGLETAKLSSEVQQMRYYGKKLEDERKQVGQLERGIQDICRTEVIEAFGPGPHRVEIQLDFPPLNAGAAEKIQLRWTHARFVVELAPLDVMPHSVYFFLRAVQKELWNGSSFPWTDHKLVMAAPYPYQDIDTGIEGKRQDETKLTFREYSEDFPHERYSLGLSSGTAGHSFYINLVDNTWAHGPRGYKSDPDPCFARVVEGIDVVDAIPKWLAASEIVEIVHAKILQ